jgi:single-stranded-DNA-specific exonuclease
VVDYELPIDDISNELIDEIQRLRPFGTGNSEPLFLARDVRISSSKIVGQRHRKMMLRSASGQKSFEGIQFNVNPRIPLKTRYDKIFYRVNWNYWNGEKTAQIIIEEM